MIGLIRKLLSRNQRSYRFSAALYHEARYLFQKTIYLIFKGIPVYKATGQDKLKYKSQFGQDFLIDTIFLPNQQRGFFVEIGANDPVKNSNTYYFEKFRGYSGLSFDAIDFGARYKELRPNTKFENAVISNNEGEVYFHFVEPTNGWEDQLSGIDTKKLSGKDLKIQSRKVKATRLEPFLAEEKPIDIMTIDVEGHEIEVLKSFDLQKTRPRVILCENSGPLSEHRVLQSFMRENDYKLIARIWTADDVYVPEELKLAKKYNGAG